MHVPMGIQSEGGGIRLTLVARFQNYNSAPKQSAITTTHPFFSQIRPFLSDGSRVYVNALEGFQTVIYDPKTLSKTGRIKHQSNASHSALFQGQDTVFDYRYNRNSNSGDPNHLVENLWNRH